ncbi:WhiB family transcriptional regulator [Demequina sp. NBRC 110052]|uniref:WhiB family transcriptional regulator n=1 Tax=Demequina sp. NBRC 110052 TaxID=1570341 RepID=UPI000A01380A|nr:WhiB family transcriptional regulator [Demequina sp. NBRC 110052]
MWSIYDGTVPSDAGKPTPTLAPVVDIFDAVDDDGPLGWQERALCAQTDPEAFFPEKGGSTREAKKVCASCDVRSECLDYALEHDERFGIWGGLSERERRKLKRRAV